MAPVNPKSKKQQFGDAGKTPEAGRNGRQKGRFFSSRPVTWCILVISRQIAFIHLHIFGFTSPKNFESRLKADPEPHTEFQAFLAGSVRRPPIDLVQVRIHVRIAHTEQDKANRCVQKDVPFR